jgi:hypothetical protein
MKQKNPHSHRHTLANERRTQKQVERYHTLKALRRTWDQSPSEMQARNHGYIIKLRAKERMVKNLLLHRADRSAEI